MSARYRVHPYTSRNGHVSWHVQVQEKFFWVLPMWATILDPRDENLPWIFTDREVALEYMKRAIQEDSTK